MHDDLGRPAKGRRCVHDSTAAVPPVDRPASATLAGSTKKCTEPVAPSSGFPTDCRRSDRRSESHRPRKLRTRCIADSRGTVWGRQSSTSQVVANCALLFSQQVDWTLGVCSSFVMWTKRLVTQGPAARFAEPGTLSSTFPTNVPLPRSAPRGVPPSRRRRARRRQKAMSWDASDQRGPVKKSAALCDRLRTRTGGAAFRSGQRSAERLRRCTRASRVAPRASRVRV